MKIKSKINLSFALAVFCVLLVVGLTIGFYTQNLVLKNTYFSLSSNNQTRAEHIRTFIQEQEKLSVVLAAASVYRDFLKESVTSSQYTAIRAKIDKRLVRTLEADSNIYKTFILNADGKILASSNKTDEGLDKSKDDYFVRAKDGVFLKDVYFSETIKKFIYTISAPIKDDNGVLLGISVLSYLPNTFISILKNNDLSSASEESFLINKDKFFISTSRFLGDVVILKQKDETKDTASCFDSNAVAYIKKNGYAGLSKRFGLQVAQLNDYRNVSVVTTHAYIPETDWCLVTKIDSTDVLSFRKSLIYIFGSIFFGTLIVFMLVGFLIAEEITRSIRALMLGIEKIKRGYFDHKIEVDTHDEIAELAAAFNTMSSAVKESRIEVDKKVKDQTQELEEKNQKLEQSSKELEKALEMSEQVNKLMVGRELKMLELKEKLRKFEK